MLHATFVKSSSMNKNYKFDCLYKVVITIVHTNLPIILVHAMIFNCKIIINCYQMKWHQKLIDRKGVAFINAHKSCWINTTGQTDKVISGFPT